MSVYLVIADVHENAESLQAALQLGEAQNADQIIFLGDAAGHHQSQNGHADFLKCLDLLQAKQAVCFRGNWEAWILSPENDTTRHQARYKDFLQRRRENMNEGHHRWISTWHLTKTEGDFTFTHGCPYQAYEDAAGNYQARQEETYIQPFDTWIIDDIFNKSLIPSPHMVFAHTHRPGYFTYNGFNTPRWHELRSEMLNVDIPYHIRVDDVQLHFAINPGTLSSEEDHLEGYLKKRTVLMIDSARQIFRFLHIE